jgi:hypothetical protein
MAPPDLLYCTQGGQVGTLHTGSCNLVSLWARSGRQKENISSETLAGMEEGEKSLRKINYAKDPIQLRIPNMLYF